MDLVSHCPSCIISGHGHLAALRLVYCIGHWSCRKGDKAQIEQQQDHGFLRPASTGAAVLGLKNPDPKLRVEEVIVDIFMFNLAVSNSLRVRMQIIKQRLNR